MKRFLKAPVAFLSVLFVLSIASSTAFTQNSKVSKFVEKKEGVVGRYIVLFEDATVEKSNFREIADSYAQHFSYLYGGNVDGVFHSAVTGFVLSASKDAAVQLSKDPRIKLVEQDSYVQETAVESTTAWGLDRIDQRGLPLNSRYSYGSNASNVHAYIIDSGIRPTHSEFGGRATADYDALSDGRNGIDCTGHGTHVAGTIGGSTYGVAKNVRLHGVRVLPCTGAGLTSHLMMGVDWVTANHVSPAVANISIQILGISTAFENAIQSSINSGVTYVVTGGNGNVDSCIVSPGHLSSAITVGAVGADDAKASYSNWGACVDIWAPGTSITSASHLNDTATQVMSGTSMATPHVAGIAALYLAGRPNATPAQVQQVLKTTSTTGIITGLDANSPNRLVYSWLDGTPPPASPGRVTIRKRVENRMPEGNSAAFNYQATNFPVTTFTLNPNGAVDSNVSQFGSGNTITVQEAAVPGWHLTSIQCTETSGDGSNVENTTVNLQNRSASIVVEEGENIDCTFTSDQLVPTSAPASISGKVVDRNGQGMRGVMVQILDATSGQTTIAMTNQFGRYSVSGLPIQHFYVLTLQAGKKSPFHGRSRAFTLTEDMVDVNFYVQ